MYNRHATIAMMTPNRCGVSETLNEPTPPDPPPPPVHFASVISPAQYIRSVKHTRAQKHTHTHTQHKYRLLEIIPPEQVQTGVWLAPQFSWRSHIDLPGQGSTCIVPHVFSLITPAVLQRQIELKPSQMGNECIFFL